MLDAGKAKLVAARNELTEPLFRDELDRLIKSRTADALGNTFFSAAEHDHIAKLKKRKAALRKELKL